MKRTCGVRILWLAAGLTALSHPGSCGEDLLTQTYAMIQPAADRSAAQIKIRTQLIEAINSRQAIRRFLFEHGRRADKDMIATADGKLSGWFLFGLGGAQSSLHAEQYERIVKGGEIFLLARLGSSTIDLLRQIDQREKTNPIDPCVLRLVTRLTHMPVVSDNQITELKANLQKFQTTLDSLETETMFLNASDPAKQAYQEIKTWAEGSQIKVTSLEFDQQATLTHHAFKKTYYLGLPPLFTDCSDADNTAPLSDSFISDFIKANFHTVESGDLRVY